MRKQFEFTGTTTKTASLDPAEFRGLSIPKITGEIARVMAEIAPDVNFFPAELEAAATELAGG